ncbi:MAG: lytic transglycosylase domain-containing protein [Bacteroidales bacterium]
MRLFTANKITNPFIRFMLRAVSFLAFMIIMGVIIQLFSFFKTEKPAGMPGGFKNDYAIYALDIPEKLEFAGEAVPLENFDVWESFDRELMVNTYWQSQTLLFIKRAERYFPLIEPILEEYEIPDDFKYLALAESGMTNAVSPAGAVGFWQFLRGTARDYGLEVNEEVDERYHIEKSTEAACRFLLESYTTYGNWTMAAASYNAGRRGMNNQIGIQKETNYYDLLLNEETQRYLFRILAIKTILENPSEYGFHVKETDLYPPLDFFIVQVDEKVIDFADFAKKFNTNYKILKHLNPWLRKPYITNLQRKTYSIKLPLEGARTRAHYYGEAKTAEDIVD